MWYADCGIAVLNEIKAFIFIYVHVCSHTWYTCTWRYNVNVISVCHTSVFCFCWSVLGSCPFFQMRNVNMYRTSAVSWNIFSFWAASDLWAKPQLWLDDKPTWGLHAKLVLSSCLQTDDGLETKGVILKQFHLEANYFSLEKWGTLKSKEKIINWEGRSIQRAERGKRCWFARIWCCSQFMGEILIVKAGAEQYGRMLKQVAGKGASSGDVI